MDHVAVILTDLTPSQQKHSLINHFYFYQVLDLSNNDLKGFSLLLPALRELHLSGNKILRLPSGGLFPNLQTLTIQVKNIFYFFLQSSLYSPV